MSGIIKTLCWDSRGKLVFDQVISRVQKVFLFNETLDWLPDASGWIVSGHVIDRRTKRIVFAVRLPFASEPAFFPLDRDRLVGSFPHDPEMVQVVTIPWSLITASLKLIQEGAPAILSESEPVTIRCDLVGIRGDASVTEQLLKEKLATRLQAEGIRVEPGGASEFHMRFSEKAGDMLPVYERQSRFNFRGKDTGRKVAEAEGSLVIELIVDGDTLWRDSLSASSSRSFREDVNDASVRKSMLTNIARGMEQLNIPYFIPKAEDQIALPVVL
ncbi:unnamed protein product, partial [Hapterophycus canaliculatus]